MMAALLRPVEEIKADAAKRLGGGAAKSVCVGVAYCRDVDRS
jgi:hypothetical protein